MDVLLKMAITRAFERQYPQLALIEIERTTSKCVPDEIAMFSLVAVAQCGCTQDAIALQYGKICAFIGSDHYDKIDEAVQQMQMRSS